MSETSVDIVAEGRLFAETVRTKYVPTPAVHASIVDVLCDEVERLQEERDMWKGKYQYIEVEP